MFICMEGVRLIIIIVTKNINFIKMAEVLCNKTYEQWPEFIKIVRNTRAQ